MALFTDGIVATTEDLRSYESSVLEVASTEGIALDRKLHLAQQTLANEIRAFLQRRNNLRADQQLENVFVTEALLHAHCMHALELTYRDAYHSQLNDRHRGKWIEYKQLAQRSLWTLFEVGVGIVAQPVPKATTPVVSVAGGAPSTSRTYAAAIAWQNAAGQCGAMSAPLVITPASDEVLVIQPASIPPSVIAWDIFLGDSERDMYRQNLVPLNLGYVWTQPDAGVRRDLPEPKWLKPDWYVQNRRELLRG